MRRLTRLGLARLGLTAVFVAATAVGVSAAPAFAEDDPCVDVTADTDPEGTSRPSLALDLMGVVAAQDAVSRFGSESKRPVRVAVVGSGVAEVPDSGITVAETKTMVDDPDLAEFGPADPSATIAAGLIAAAPRDDDDPIGIAPDAEVVDVRVYVDDDPTTDAPGPDPAVLATGLTWVADNADRLDIKVATVGFTTDRSKALSKAVQRVRDAGVVLVAASGDRPLDPEKDFAERTKGEDAAKDFYPAGYEDVLVVNSTSDGDPEPDALRVVVKNSQTMLAAPTFDAVSYGLNGETCLVQPISTSAAAAEVGGVAALLWQISPSDTTPAQIVARLLNTATGTMDGPTPLVGAGVVQPYEAVTRPLEPSADGTVERTTTQVDPEVTVTSPEPEGDLLAQTRDDAVWWGLIGGGVLVVALLLRPVLARRRQ